MLPRSTTSSSPSASCAGCRKNPVEPVKLQHQGQCESRVSTDSDLDLESEDEYDGCVDGDDAAHQKPFLADLLVHKLEQVQCQDRGQAFWDARYTQVTPSLQQLKQAEESYWDKMRRISQWRESTHQSETSSVYSPPESDNEPAPAPITRKRPFSDASLPDSTKRVRVSVPSSATPGSPSAPAYSLSLPSDSVSDPGAHPRAYVGTVPWLDALHVCTACDAVFASRQRLRRHARSAPVACKAAVTYGLE